MLVIDGSNKISLNFIQARCLQIYFALLFMPSIWTFYICNLYNNYVNKVRTRTLFSTSSTASSKSERTVKWNTVKYWKFCDPFSKEIFNGLLSYFLFICISWFRTTVGRTYSNYRVAAPLEIKSIMKDLLCNYTHKTCLYFVQANVKCIMKLHQ